MARPRRERRSDSVFGGGEGLISMYTKGTVKVWLPPPNASHLVTAIMGCHGYIHIENKKTINDGVYFHVPCHCSNIFGGITQIKDLITDLQDALQKMEAWKLNFELEVKE